MPTYNLTFNDSLVAGVRQTFPTQASITSWMNLQIERMLRQIATTETKNTLTPRKISVSDKIKALSAVPPSNSTADYKEELALILADKYGN